MPEKKNELLYIYSLNATVSGKEGAVIKNAKNVNVVLNTENHTGFRSMDKSRFATGL